MVDSKDAKSIVPGDIAPIQKPMTTWKQQSGILPDHDWQQGRKIGTRRSACGFSYHNEKLLSVFE